MSAMSKVFWTFCMAGVIFVPNAGGADEFAQIRERMVRDYVAPAGVSDPRVLESVRNTPRHQFMPRRFWDQAYFDMALPIGKSQTISSPFIVAAMTEAIEPEPTDKVLEIGTGSGYQAAVLSPLVSEVYTIEIVPELGEQAARDLARLEYTNVHVRVGDGFKGWPEQAPFDAIIVTCSPESVPQPLVDQLREGGRMVIPVGERYQQTLYLMTKQDGKLVQRALRPTLFVPMTGSAESQRQQQPDPQNPRVVNGSFEAKLPASSELVSGGDANASDAPQVSPALGLGGGQFVPGWYYGRQVELVSGSGQNSHFVRFTNETPGRDSHLLQGLAIDGTVIPRLRVEARVRTSDVQPGVRPDQVPTVAISFYDSERRNLGNYWISTFRGTRDWKLDGRTFRVPPQTREAILRIGLFGATGQVDFDDVKIEALK